MHQRTAWIAVVVSILAFGSVPPAAPAATPAAIAAPPELVDSRYKNIQVLNGLPVSDLLPVMHFMRASLGVRCEYCHVAEEGKYELDDKLPKQRAREMIKMVRAINNATFEGRTAVTCNSCHRGSTRPIPIPITGTDYVNTTRTEPDEPPALPLPSFPDLLRNYEEATHLAGVTTARISLQSARAKLLDANNPLRARVIARALTEEVDVLVKGPRAINILHRQDGSTLKSGTDGVVGWSEGQNGVLPVNESAVPAFARRVNPFAVVRVSESDFSGASVESIDRINGEDAYSVRATDKDGKAQRLWFSKKTGLLIRRTFYRQIILGLDPEQYDLSAYQKFGSTTLPSLINASYTDDQHLGIERTIHRVEIGAEIRDSEFTAPRK